jgi:hypothetical protein
MIVEKQMECRLAGENEVFGEYLPQSQFVLTSLTHPRKILLVVLQIGNKK